MSFSDEELTALYDRYGGVLHARCLRILKDDALARDAVQETFAKVLVHADQFRQQSSPLTWMYRISTNHCLNQLRNQQGRADKLERRATELQPQAPVADGSPEDWERVRGLLDGVDAQTRQVVMHTYFDECTRQEVADLVGISVPTVRKRLNGFLAHARRALGVVAALLLTLLGALPWT